MKSFRAAGLQNSTILCCRNQPKTHRPLLTLKQCQIAIERIQTKGKQQTSFCTSIDMGLFKVLCSLRLSHTHSFKVIWKRSNQIKPLRDTNFVASRQAWNFLDYPCFTLEFPSFLQTSPIAKPVNWVAITCFKIVVISCLFQSWVESFGATRTTCNIENMAGMVFMRCLWRPRYTSCGNGYRISRWGSESRDQRLD